MAYRGEELRREIRRLREQFYSHEQIFEMLNIPRSTYFYHWRLINEENQKVYDEQTTAKIKEDTELAIGVLQRKYRELQDIIDKPESQDTKIRAIETQMQVVTAIPKIRQQGASFLETIGSQHINTRESEADKQVSQ